MKITDLGAIEGRVLAFGGPYSNIHATQALLQAAQDHGVAPDHMICTGDVVAYCAAPVETLDCMIKSKIVTVAGNCERQLAAAAPDCGCGFDEGSACDLLSSGWYSYANRLVSETHRAWMAGCPDIVTFTQDGKRFTVIHGGITDIARFIWSSTPEAVFMDEIQALTTMLGPVDHVIAGHSGLAFTRRIGTVQWTNAGVIGMPPHDGTPHTAYATLTNGQSQLHRLSYNATAARTLMQERGLTQGYHQALTTGIWPSEDVLPPELRHSAIHLA